MFIIKSRGDFEGFFSSLQYVVSNLDFRNFNHKIWAITYIPKAEWV